MTEQPQSGFDVSVLRFARDAFMSNRHFEQQAANQNKPWAGGKTVLNDYITEARVLNVGTRSLIGNAFQTKAKTFHCYNASFDEYRAMVNEALELLIGNSSVSLSDFRKCQKTSKFLQGAKACHPKARRIVFSYGEQRIRPLGGQRVDPCIWIISPTEHK